MAPSSRMWSRSTKLGASSPRACPGSPWPAIPLPVSMKRLPACSMPSACRTLARAFVQEKLPELRKLNTVVIANVFGHSREDYEDTIEILNDGEGIAAYELNVSCPNTAAGGMVFGCDIHLLDDVVATAKRATWRPIIVKLSPNVTSIATMAQIAEAAGADALSLVNTFLAMSIDVETRRPRIANVTAGLSGPAIKPIAVRMVYEAAHVVDIPVIG